MSRAVSLNRNWEAESDAYALAEAKAIMADKSRLAAAKKVAPKIMPDMEKNAAAARVKLTALKSLAKQTPRRRKR